MIRLVYVPCTAMQEENEMQSKDCKRRFETLEKSGWMNFNTDDLLYGMIQYIATYNPLEKEESRKLYVTKQNVRKHKKEIAEICGCTTKTIDNKIKRLVDCGLLEEFITDDENSAYGIIVNYDAPYQLIDREWLKYLIDTRSKHALRVYFYLLDKYIWKQRENSLYVFTQKEIKLAFGYSENTRLIDSTIGNVLRSMRREGIIDYEEFYVESEINGEIVHVPKNRLKFVARSEKELKSKNR